MSTSNKKMTDEARIRDLIEKWARAVRAKNIDGIMALHAPDILLFDVPPPVQSLGADAYRKSWEQFFSWFGDSGIFELSDLKITAGDAIAASHRPLSCGRAALHGNKAEV